MKSIFAVALFATSIAGIGAATAMPLAPLGSSETTEIIQVAQGCGPGFARGPYGRCRPMYRAGPVVVRPIVRPGRLCPPGLVYRYGRCRPF